MQENYGDEYKDKLSKLFKGNPNCLWWQNVELN